MKQAALYSVITSLLRHMHVHSFTSFTILLVIARIPSMVVQNIYCCPNGSCWNCYIYCWCGDVVRAKRVLHHSSQPPPTGTDHYEMVDEGEKRVPLGAGVYEEVDKQDTQTDRHTKHYQELDLSKMERGESLFLLSFNQLVHVVVLSCL